MSFAWITCVVMGVARAVRRGIEIALSYRPHHEQKIQMNSAMFEPRFVVNHLFGKRHPKSSIHNLLLPLLHLW